MVKINPKVTVYITTFNRLELLKRAIKSVQTQTYSNIEIIVADDSSNDGSQSYLAELQGKGILKAILNTGDSKGACYGRNKAIELSTGEFITGLDDDDFFEEFRIENFVNYWSELDNHKGIAGLFDSAIEMRPDDKYKCYETPQATYSSLRKSNEVGNQIFTPVSLIKGVSGFDENMPALQDWDTWLRITREYGQLINISSHSYIIDQVHDSDRISAKKPTKVRAAFHRLSEKLQPMLFTEKVALLDSMYSYKQMNIVFKELLILLIGFKFRKVAQVLKRRFVNE